MLLFSDRSLWTMLHGIVFGGAALMAIAAALFALLVARPSDTAPPDVRLSRSVAALLVFTAVALWLTTLTGTYVVFPPYRATPPPGVTELSEYPRALIMASQETRWLHAFAMESKEHMPWIASMLATAVAFVASRHRLALWENRAVRNTTTALLAICFALVAFVSLMGIFVNKIAPLQ